MPQQEKQKISRLKSLLIQLHEKHGAYRSTVDVSFAASPVAHELGHWLECANISCPKLEPDEETALNTRLQAL